MLLDSFGPEALGSGAGARAKDKWGIFKSIDDARLDPVHMPGSGLTGGSVVGGGCAQEEKESLQDEVALLKGKLAAAKSLAAEAERKLEESRKQTAALQQQHHDLLQERRAAQEEVVRMKMELREARDALSASHKASKDVMIDYLRALREAEARSVPRQPSSSPSPPSASAFPHVTDEEKAQRSRGQEAGRQKAAQNEHAAELRRGSSAVAGAESSLKQAGPGNPGRNVDAPAQDLSAEGREEEEMVGDMDAEVEVEVKGSEGVFVVKARELVLTREGQVRKISLRDIKTVTSSPQGTIRVVGGGGVVLMEGPRLSSFPMDQLGMFFEVWGVNYVCWSTDMKER